VILMASGSLAAGCARSAVHFLFVRPWILSYVTGECVFCENWCPRFFVFGPFCLWSRNLFCLETDVSVFFTCFCLELTGGECLYFLGRGWGVVCLKS